MSAPYMYMIGYKVGKVVRESVGKKKVIEVIYDETNGTSEANGIDSPTSNFLNALASATSYYSSILTIRNAKTTSVLIPGILELANHVSLVFDASLLNQKFTFSFTYLDNDNSVLSKFI